MKALVWLGKQDFEVQDVPEPKAEPGRIVVKVSATAVCGSDFHLQGFGATPPLIPGHEASGVVVETGKGVKGLSNGNRVALNPVQFCGQCWCCTHGLPHLCVNYRHLGDKDIAGSWAEYVAIDAANAFLVPDSVDDIAACLSEPLAVCYESLSRAGLKKGDSVLIIGDGPFGFLHAQIADALGAGAIVVAGHYEQRLERISVQTGAIPCDTRKQDLSEVLRKNAGTQGVDIVIEATGAGPSPNIGIRALRPRGTLIIFSYVWKPEPLDMAAIHMKELNVLGACRSLNAFEQCITFMNHKKVNTRLLADVIVPFEQWPHALKRLTTDKANVFKAVFTPNV